MKCSSLVNKKYKKKKEKRKMSINFIMRNARVLIENIMYKPEMKYRVQNGKVFEGRKKAERIFNITVLKSNNSCLISE
jgi:hypothetical protein